MALCKKESSLRGNIFTRDDQTVWSSSRSVRTQNLLLNRSSTSERRLKTQGSTRHTECPSLGNNMPKGKVHGSSVRPWYVLCTTGKRGRGTICFACSVLLNLWNRNPCQMGSQLVVVGTCRSLESRTTKSYEPVLWNGFWSIRHHFHLQVH